MFVEYLKENRSIVNDELKAKIYSSSTKVVQLEDAFIDLAFGNFQIQGIDKSDLKQFIRYLADRRLLQLGMKPIHGVKENPMRWLDWILNGTSHDNFFERRVTEYSLNSMSGEWDWPSVVSKLQ